MIFTLDQLLDRTVRLVGDRLKRPECVSRRHLEPSASEHVAELAVGRRAQPGKDLAFGLPATPLLSEEAGLLEGILDLLARGGRVPGGDLGAQLRGEVPCGDPGEQRPRVHGAGYLSIPLAHYP